MYFSFFYQQLESEQTPVSRLTREKIEKAAKKDALFKNFSIEEEPEGKMHRGPCSKARE